jgi:rare lipoprotein A
MLKSWLKPLFRFLLNVAFALCLALPAQSANIGWASFYKTGRVTASGEAFKPMGLTAAHRKLPFGTKLKVTNIRNGQSVIVRVNDRGPFIKGRLLDLSLGAAKIIGLHRSGVAKISFVIMK